MKKLRFAGFSSVLLAAFMALQLSCSGSSTTTNEPATGWPWGSLELLLNHWA
ncbi:MAG: hypothetical protein OEZ04_01600 [Nitrospinota bacterium]|nr:hypothetical protein [Nitrospinota bacterium]